MTRTYDFVWQQGTDGVIKLKYTIGKPAVPVDLTGYSLRMDIRSDTGGLLYVINSAGVDESPLLAGSGPEAQLGTDGSILIVIPRSASITDGPLASNIDTLLGYDIMLRSPENLQKKILQGTIILEGSRTQWA